MKKLKYLFHLTAAVTIALGLKYGAIKRTATITRVRRLKE